MGFYSKFSEQDLIESYKNQIDYQGKPSKELIEEIKKRSSLKEFQLKVEDQKKTLDERNRIIREIHQHYMNKSSELECLTQINSDIYTKKEIRLMIHQKYNHISQNVENLKVDSDTILFSILGIMVSTIASSVILLLCLYQFEFLAIFHFYLIIPVYIINYLIIKSITRKTRDNLVVFLATFIATILNVLIFILLLR
ncbi:hypothetical protein [Chryseobacterium cheonjiense]|uniref:Uncharacterized protein n=1 Tax=Chryseobacterium cheonjiense TaxID=2728845 RepID=A0A7Y0FJ98_9FLAO|nr:hypothetical protein [Chryseobacterium cheonjiense]NML57972.1 hypothetical protein [Chryseobacterium cheonjiense]